MNGKTDRSGEGTAHTFCEIFISKAAIKQLFVAAIRFRQVRKFVARVGIADRNCHVNVLYTWWGVMWKIGRSHLLVVRCRKTKYKCKYFTSTMSVIDVFLCAPHCLHKYRIIILSDNYWLPLPVRSFVQLEHSTYRPPARWRCGWNLQPLGESRLLWGGFIIWGGALFHSRRYCALSLRM